MKLEDCPKFEHCSAPLCPLDEDLEKRSHLPGERVCIYVLEYAKEPFRGILRGSISEEHWKAVAEAFPDIYDRNTDTRRRVKRASHTPSRLGRVIPNG
jgi:hypothetical protein